MNKKTESAKRLNLLNLPDGVYFDEKSFGMIHLMTAQKSIFGIDEYVYKGKIHKGRCCFLTGKNLSKCAPSGDNWNHGFTLEGIAQEIFTVDKALIAKNAAERRTFCYTNSNSVLKFVGDPKKKYNIFARIYENAYGIGNYRWVVIYAEAAKAE